MSTKMRTSRLCLILSSLALAVALLAACSQAVEAPETVEQQPGEVESTVEAEIEKTVEVVVEVSPPPPATQAQPSPFPTPTTPLVAPTSTESFPTAIPPALEPLVEAHTVELEWPPSMRLGDSDVIRLALFPTENGYSITTDFPGHDVVTQTVQVTRPGGYDLIAIARLDGVGFALSPIGDQPRSLPPGEAVTWRWALSPNAPGQQRLTVTLLLRWMPQPGTVGTVREALAYSRGLDVRVTSFFGLSRGQAMIGGLLGLFLGGGLTLLGMVSLVPRGILPATQASVPNPALVLEPRPGLALSAPESSLLRALFRRYARLALESEFLSGYSGARTFLALPVRPDGRADAYTIVKIGQQDAIEQEFRNYEVFVKDTLPPITARIQHPPVTVRGSRQAALQYTFIAEPGRMPVSLRQALTANPDPALLNKLFETFGPNWWMQRHSRTFRLAEEYDRVLPTHYVIEPLRGRGAVLDGHTAPAGLDLQIGELVTLRNFPHAEQRADGQSLSLRGEPPPGSPPLRVRWLSPDNPEGATGRVAATRRTLLEGFIARLDLLGLPDPLQRLPALLNERLSGTLSTIHGDLNLENVLVGPGDFIWLIDFAMTRDGHPLYDFAHLEAEIIAHVIAPRTPAGNYLQALRADQDPLLRALHEIAGRCLFNPSQPREYFLALYMACVGALKYTNLGPAQKHLLYLTAAFLSQDL